jgi:hypothetical protein
MYAQSLCKVGRDREPLKFQILVNERKGCVGGSSKSQAQEKECKSTSMPKSFREDEAQEG